MYSSDINPHFLTVQLTSKLIYIRVHKKILSKKRFNLKRKKKWFSSHFCVTIKEPPSFLLWKLFNWHRVRKMKRGENQKDLSLHTPLDRRRVSAWFFRGYLTGLWIRVSRTSSKYNMTRFPYQASLFEVTSPSGIVFQCENDYAPRRGSTLFPSGKSCRFRQAGCHPKEISGLPFLT